MPTRRNALKSIAGALGLAGAATSVSPAAVTPQLTGGLKHELETSKLLIHLIGAQAKLVVDELEPYAPGLRASITGEMANATSKIRSEFPGILTHLDIGREFMHGFSGESTREHERKEAAREIERAEEKRLERAEYERALGEWEQYEPTEAEIDEHLEFDRASDHERFAEMLESARAMLKHYPGLVTAGQFPSEHLEALRKQQEDPDYEPDLEVPDSFLRPATPDNRAHAREYLTRRHREYEKPKAPVMGYNLIWRAVREGAGPETVQ